ncbi:PREDICTED: prostaglandin D2 receptor-like [Nanorana parkeri]|uniref:prostaglandin D2 receptor-like n=1 Tax=Nanorana parkeri TaxID=125878 RepID=UPI0008550272|nr:PREDICTED: prostaglandin D2 receptor-like [Nanorana parkeri]
MELYPCSSRRHLQGDHSVLPSSVLFAAGLLGNIIALIILWQHKLNVKTTKSSVFYILVTGLTIVNLTGKIIVCPVVIAAYSKNETLFQLTDNQSLCQFFAFCMTLFGLAPTLILLAMAVDCWLALAYPFTYQRYITNKVGLLVPFVFCVFSLGFCSLPFFGIGRFVQYCPGTWCFIEMTMRDSAPMDRMYSILYGTIMGLVVIGIIVFNMAIMRCLYIMYQKKNKRTVAGAIVGNKGMDGSQARMKEMDHLILLAVMTVIFAVCSLPLTARVYVGVFTDKHNEYYDLIVLRLVSMNSVVDPWIFIICRTSHFHRHLGVLCNKLRAKTDVRAHFLQQTVSL